MHRAIQEFKHEHTIYLRAPTAQRDTTKLYLNEQIINHTLQILHAHSPYRATRHFIPTYFSELIQYSHANLTPIYIHHLEDRDDASLNHFYIRIPINITPTHWKILARHNDCDGTI